MQCYNSTTTLKSCIRAPTLFLETSRWSDVHLVRGAERQFEAIESYRPQIEWMEPRTLLSAVNWTGLGGDNNWDTPTNWSTSSVPGSGDDVTINTAANVVHSAAVTDSIKSLTSSEPVGDLRRHALDLRDVMTTAGLTIDGGTLAGTAAVTVDALLTLTAGTLSTSGRSSPMAES